MYHEAGSLIAELEFGTPHAVLDEGRTRPILFQLEKDGAPRGGWVVKVADKRPCALFVELACSDLCAHFGLRTPEVGVARVPDFALDYGETEAGVAATRMHASQRNELLFCSRHLPGCTRLTKENLRWPRGDQDEQATLLFLFDAFVWHADRTTENPNALWHENKIVAIDHGRAMYNIEETSDSGLGPDFAQHRASESWPRHIAFDFLKKRWGKPGIVRGMEQFSRGVRALDDVTIRAISARWPAGLDKGGMRGEIVRFLAARCLVYAELEQKVRDVLQAD